MTIITCTSLDITRTSHYTPLIQREGGVGVGVIGLFNQEIMENYMNDLGDS